MRRLREQVAEYLRVRRSLGYKLVEHERFLNQFLDYLEQEQATTITAANALAWAKLPAGVNPRWHGARLSAVRGFAAWAQAFDPPSRFRRPGCSRCAPPGPRPTCIPRTRSAR